MKNFQVGGKRLKSRGATLLLHGVDGGRGGGTNGVRSEWWGRQRKSHLWQGLLLQAIHLLVSAVCGE